jgi:hypothetical protein
MHLHYKVWVNLCVLTIEKIERALFSEVRILVDAAFTRKQHGERGISRRV